MKLNINYQRIEYGFAEIEVPDDATEEDILNAADAVEKDGNVNWQNDIVTVVDYDKINK